MKNTVTVRLHSVITSTRNISGYPFGTVWTPINFISTYLFSKKLSKQEPVAQAEKATVQTVVPARLTDRRHPLPLKVSVDTMIIRGEF